MLSLSVLACAHHHTKRCHYFCTPLLLYRAQVWCRVCAAIMAIKEKELLQHRQLQQADSAFYDGLDTLPQLQASVQRLQPHLKSLHTIFAEVQQLVLAVL
jgi:hypothetical protein